MHSNIRESLLSRQAANYSSINSKMLGYQPGDYQGEATAQFVPRPPPVTTTIPRGGGCLAKTGGPYMSTLKDKCAIVGVGETVYNRDSGRTELNMAVEGGQPRHRRRGSCSPGY